MRRLCTRATRLRLFLVAASISVVTLAASSPIYSGVSGSAVSGTAATCSVATASKLETDRVAGVVCGAFLGAGSQAMVVNLTNGTCLPFLGWDLFGFKAGVWRMVTLPPHGGLSGNPVTAAGNDIRETLPIRRPGDSLCNPTGGTKTRIWHWNGTSFTASAWKVTPPKSGSTTVKLDFFQSPSHNIQCSIEVGEIEGCYSRNLPHNVYLSHDGTVRICNGRKCLGPGGTGPPSTAAPVLAYGQKSELYGYRCTSTTKGITCTVLAGPGKGKGFLINAAGVTKVGP